MVDFFYSLRKSTQSWNVFRPTALGSKRRLPWPPWLCRPRPCGHFGYRVCQPWPPTRSSPSMCTRRKAYNVAAKRWGLTGRRHRPLVRLVRSKLEQTTRKHVWESWWVIITRTLFLSSHIIVNIMVARSCLIGFLFQDLCSGFSYTLTQLYLLGRLREAAVINVRLSLVLHTYYRAYISVGIFQCHLPKNK